MPETALPVEFLFRLTAQLAEPLPTGGGPQGPRVIYGVTGGTFEGPRLRGTVVGVGGDWLTMRPDGTFKLDVRATLRTDDGAAILMTYNGIGRVQDGQPVIRTAPLFETGDERYGWLNTVQAVGLSVAPPAASTVSYDVYALR